MGHSLVTRRNSPIAYHRYFPNISRRVAVLAGNQITARFKDALRPWASALPQFSGLPSWSRTMGVLKHHGFSPVTVFDIGVGYGTFPLYRAFPDAFYHLIDPAHESLAHMHRSTP